MENLLTLDFFGNGAQSVVAVPCAPVTVRLHMACHMRRSHPVATVTNPEPMPRTFLWYQFISHCAEKYATF
jgi:hypothetical protein